MAVLNVLVDRGPADVWDVLADGSAYGEWVMGARQTTRARAAYTSAYVPEAR